MLPLISSSYIQIAAAIATALGVIFWLTKILDLFNSQRQAQKSLVNKINRLLPQTQCGQCGHPGCLPYARAISRGEAPNKCPPGGLPTLLQLADLLNEPNRTLDPAHGLFKPFNVAVVREDECIGCTKCIQACPVDAILGGPKLMHTVIESECTGCDLCVEPCPVDCIDMISSTVAGKNKQPELPILKPLTGPEQAAVDKPMNILQRFATKFDHRDRLPAGKIAPGIKPLPYKEKSLRSVIMAAPLPEQLTIPIGRSNGRIASPIVNVGERVLKYQKLSTAPVHAPTSGTIKAIEMAVIRHQLFENQLCLQLSPDGLEETAPLKAESNYHSLKQSQLLDKIAEAGLATAKNLKLALQKKIDLLIINAAECEPYISAAEALIRERALEVMIGADILKLAGAADRCIIAIGECQKDAIAALQEAAKNPLLENIAIELLLIPDKYPADEEKLLIHYVTGLEVPAGHHPVDIGILTQSAGTAFAAFQAVVEGKACVSHLTTLSGNALKTPKNFEALTGTPVEFLFDVCGIDRSVKVKSIEGGSLTGHEIFNDKAVVSNTSHCLIAGTAEEFPARAQEQACIRCGVCADVCPVNLLPQQLYAFSKSANTEQLLQHGLFDCIECGACDYVCPSHIPLVKYYRESKNAMQARQLELEKSQQWQQRFQYHQYRIKKNKDQNTVRKANMTMQASIDPLKNAEKENAEKENTEEENTSTQEYFSREKASREIAAAVARVKARKGKATKKPPGGSVD